MFFMVGMRGLEPRTSSLSEKRSNQLSYTPEFVVRTGRYYKFLIICQNFGKLF